MRNLPNTAIKFGASSSPTRRYQRHAPIRRVMRIIMGNERGSDPDLVRLADTD